MSRGGCPARRRDPRRRAAADAGGAMHRLRDPRAGTTSSPTTSSGMRATTAVSRSSSSAPTRTMRSRPWRPPSVGTLPLVGMNARGGALGLMSLSGADERIGVPRALLGRDGIEAIDRTDAIRRVSRPHRAGGYSYMYAFRGGGAFTLEVTATRGAWSNARSTPTMRWTARGRTAESPRRAACSRFGPGHALSRRAGRKRPRTRCGSSATTVPRGRTSASIPTRGGRGRVGDPVRDGVRRRGRRHVARARAALHPPFHEVRLADLLG